MPPTANTYKRRKHIAALTHGAPDGEDEVCEEAGKEDGVAKGAVLDRRVVQPRVPAQREAAA